MIAFRAIILYGFFSVVLPAIASGCYQRFTSCFKSEEDLPIGEFLLGRLQNHIYSPFNRITKFDDESIIETEPKEQEDALKKINSDAMNNKVTKTTGKSTSEVLRTLATKKVETRQDDDCGKCDIEVCVRAIRNSVIFGIIGLIMRKIRKAIDKHDLERKRKGEENLAKLKKKIGK